MKKIKIKKTKETKEKKPKTKKIKSKNRKRVSIILGLLMFFGITVLVLILIGALYIVFTSPKFDPEELYNKELTVLYDSAGTEIASIGSENREIVTYDDLPQVLIDAIVATEDARFFQHGGFDLVRFSIASLGQAFGNSDAGGASTLAMQISKNTFTSNEAAGIDGIIRKFQDIYMSIFKIESNYTKEEIMEFYVNAPWLGNNTYGVEQACQIYFGKSVRDINLAEASLIAGMFQAPAAYNPYSYPENAQTRRETVLTLMVEHGYITQEQAEDANDISVQSMLAGYEQMDADPYQGFIDTVVEEVIEKEGVNPYDIPMNIYTTMDRANQDIVNALMKGELYTYINDEVQAAVALTDIKSGAISAIGNGRNRVVRDYNLATMMSRHPGSTAKPIVNYGPLIEYNNGYPGMYFWDEPMTYTNGQSLKNADGQYGGQMNMINALATSRNIPAVQAFQMNDKEEMEEFVHNLGWSYGDELYESFAIGSFEGVSPLEMSAAYGAFARGGEYIEPYSYTKIEMRQTGEIKEVEIKKVQAMSEETAFLMNTILKESISLGYGGTISVPGTDVCVKTGTSTYDASAQAKYGIPSSSAADNWVAAYTPDYSLAVWYGYQKLEAGRYITATAGNTARTRITAAVANRIFKPNSTFTAPSGVTQVTVEANTIPPLLPSVNTPENMKVTTWFKKGSEPTEVSTRYTGGISTSTTMSNPTNGKSSVSSSKITLTWNKATPPETSSDLAWEDRFKSYYDPYSDYYFNKAKSLNATGGDIGTFGYQVYLQTSSGLKSLGWTDENTYTYTAPNADSYTFVIKSAYSNSQAIMSSGLTIKATTNTGSEVGKDFTVTVNGGTTLCLKPSATPYVDSSDPVTVMSAGTDITDKVTVETFYYENNTLIPNAKSLDISTSGSSYKVTYKVTYNSTVKTASKTINVNTSC